MSTLTLQSDSHALTAAAARPEPRAHEERIFFPGLNAVRAYAALGVLVWHMRQLMMFFRVPISDPFYDGLWRCFPRGDDGVMLFFVLSGFLITYLLMAEQRRTGTIDVAKFYVRRVLRIWPLYYLLVLIGFAFLAQKVGSAREPFLLRDDHFLPRLAAYLVMMPNVAAALWPGAVPIGQLWSIGVEEQFYLVWPALLKWFNRRVLWVILGVIALKVALFYAQSVVMDQPRLFRRGEWAPVLRNAFAIIRVLRLECMAVGALAAYVAFHVARRGEGRFARWLYHPVTALLSLAPAGYVIATMWRPITPYGGIGHAAIFALAILCAGANPNLPRWLLGAMRPIDYLGRISYGIYMYHVPVMFCLLRYFAKHHVAWHSGWTYVKVGRRTEIIPPDAASVWRNVALLLLVTAITIAVATVSFYAFERPFLRAKRRYTVVRSGSPEQS